MILGLPGTIVAQDQQGKQDGKRRNAEETAMCPLNRDLFRGELRLFGLNSVYGVRGEFPR